MHTSPSRGPHARTPTRRWRACFGCIDESAPRRFTQRAELALLASSWLLLIMHIYVDVTREDAQLSRVASSGFCGISSKQEIHRLTNASSRAEIRGEKYCLSLFLYQLSLHGQSVKGKYINFGMTPERKFARAPFVGVCAAVYRPRVRGGLEGWLVLDGDHDTVYSDG